MGAQLRQNLYIHTPMKVFCRKGQPLRLLVSTAFGWRGVGIAAATVYDTGDPRTIVAFYMADQPIADQAPAIALIGEVEPIEPRPTPTEPNGQT